MELILGNFIPRDWVAEYKNNSGKTARVRKSNYNCIEILRKGFITYPRESLYYARIARKLAKKWAREVQND